MSKRRALITGITGQDGSYLAELLVSKGYEVHGIARRVAASEGGQRFGRLKGCFESVHLHTASLESYASLHRVVSTVRPDEVYHLASQSTVPASFEDEFSTFNTNIGGTQNLFSAVRELAPACRLFFAASCEMFGLATDPSQNEDTAHRPVSPYGISKSAGFHLVRLLREAHGMFACSGIMFNHESPRRGYEFVSRKISRAVALIASGREYELRLGNLAARRDWGYAKEYVLGMWLMLQSNTPEDLVLATGRSASVRDLARAAFATVDLEYENYVVEDPAFLRPIDIASLCGDASRARKQIGWEAVTFAPELIGVMVEADIQLVTADRGAPRTDGVA